MPAQNSLPPAAQLMQLLSGCFFAQAAYVAAKLGIADTLAAEPATIQKLACDVKANEAALARVMRLLEMLGVFRRGPSGLFENTPMSEALRTDAPGSLRDMAMWWCEEPHWRVYGHLLDSVRTGGCSWPTVHGKEIFPYLADTNPGLGEIFHRAMTSFSSTTIPAILEAYDFSAFGTIADLGGGKGHLLADVLRATPRAQGILFDTPSGVAGASSLLAQAGVSARAQIMTGDFFAPLPFTADAILLKHIIHDWPDADCLRILGHVHAALRGGGRLLILDMVVPDDESFHFSKICDMEMLVSAGGQERTADEFRCLLAAAGFQLSQIRPTASIISVIEAVP